MKNEEIKSKLAKLRQIYEKLRALRTSKGEVFNEDEENLLSEAQLIEEALKNYMYQFGLSIYRNKKGKRFFKKFIHDEDEVRGFDELDTLCFDFVPAQPSFWQRLFDFVPDDQLIMTKDVEETVENFYEKDSMMSEIMDELLIEEQEKCEQIIKDMEIDENIEKTFELANEISAPEAELEVDDDVPSIEEIETEIEQEISNNSYKKKRKRISPKLQKSFDCGTKIVEPSTKVKRSNSEEPALQEARKGRQNQR